MTNYIEVWRSDKQVKAPPPPRMRPTICIPPGLAAEFMEIDEELRRIEHDLFWNPGRSNQLN